MRRLLTFALLGPPLGLITILISSPLMAGGQFIPLTGWIYAIIFLPFAYLAGIGPALVAWITDASLSKVLRLEFRMITSAVVGFGATALCAYMSSEYATTRGALQLGITGAIPALACSWIADRVQNRI